MLNIFRKHERLALKVRSSHSGLAGRSFVHCFLLVQTKSDIAKRLPKKSKKETKRPEPPPPEEPQIMEASRTARHPPTVKYAHVHLRLINVFK